MKELDLAQRSHNELDREYARRLYRATVRNHLAAIKRYTDLRRMNDGAYFLVIFGTFERYVTDRAATAVGLRTAKPSYQHRRAWETLWEGSKLKATFLNRVRILLDQKSANFATLKNYYDVRNDLAHTGTTATIFSIPNVVSDLKQVVKSMKK